MGNGVCSSELSKVTESKRRDVAHVTAGHAEPGASNGLARRKPTAEFSKPALLRPQPACTAEHEMPTIEEPSDAMSEEAAKLECERLLAEMAKMDEESERLNAFMELEQMKQQLLANAGFDDPGATPTPVPDLTPSSRQRGGRQSDLSAADQARLERLLSEDLDEAANPYSNPAQTSTLRMLTGGQPAAPAAPAGDDASLPDLVNRLLAEANEHFKPDASSVEADIARMEAELKALTMQRDQLGEQIEMREELARLEAADYAPAPLALPQPTAAGGGGPRQAWD